ncbi:MAG: hypothetical protein Q8L55_04780, partial [Phycisphaerales bacterium]|nr:hypothetical protein [Phycisphaerales bacterium]
MFTGLVQAVGTVALAAVEPGGEGVLRLEIDAKGWSHRPAAGDSIAVDGCCLTVVQTPTVANRLAFQAVPQTLRLTTLGQLKAGDRV